MKRYFTPVMKTVTQTVGLLIVVLIVASVSCAAESKKVATVTIPPAPELYAAEPQPLTVNQCGQCHPGIFKNLKSDGARHRFDCQRCHTTFHAYNPKKGGWEALMPKCASCHAEPHGTTFTDCASCHANPHTPKKVVMEKRLTSACGECHVSPKEQLAKFPSKHSKLACQFCHTTHGFKPTCFNCHKPHHQGQEQSTCASCHSVHKPLQVTYDEKAPAVTCGSCHTRVFSTWQKTPSKHGKVNCATCHQSRHRFVPQCTDCHGLPHKKEIHDHFPKCLACHLDVHDLPVMQKKAKP
jgi:hypothetical protein